MNGLEAQALLIRYEAAAAAAQHVDRDGRVGLLAAAVLPSQAFLEASLEKAKQTGVSVLAVQMASGRRPEELLGQGFDQRDPSDNNQRRGSHGFGVAPAIPLS